MKNKNGKLFIVATPIGNLADITLRALETLKEVDLILCEDTRVTDILLKNYNIKKPLLIYNDYSDSNLRANILTKFKEGKNIALVSDAGTPIISDPGYKLVQILQENDIELTTIPGSCSVIAALTISGIPTDRFMFIGFLPPKKTAKESILNELVEVKTSIVFFEAANRLIETLNSVGQIFLNRQIAVVKEITKLHEQVIKGTAEEIIAYFSNNEDRLRGEMVVIISQSTSEVSICETEIADFLKLLLIEMSVKDAVNIAAEQFKVKKNQLYKLALKIKNL